VFGLEVSYFSGDVEAFVPRVVVRPSLGARIAGQDAHPIKPVLDAETYISSLPEAAQEPVRVFCDQIETIGGELQWRGYGARVRVRGDSGPKVMINLDADHLWVVIGPRKGLDPDAGVRAAKRLADITGASVGADYGSLKWATATPERIEAGLGVARDLVHELVAAASDA
jgi:hypothetical protein